MAKEFSITSQQAKVLTASIALVIFFFSYLYFSISYPVLVLLAEIFLATVTVFLLNHVVSKSEGLFQNGTAIYLELGFAIILTLILNQLGVNFATGLILLAGILFVILLLFIFVKGVTIDSGAKRGNKTLANYNAKSASGSILRSILATAITTIEFLVVFFAAVTYPLLTIGSILFFAFIFASIIISDNLDDKKVLAYVVISLFIVFSLQQLAINHIIPPITTIGSLLNFSTAIIVGIIIFVFWYLLARTGNIRGEQTSIKSVGSIGR